MAGPTSDSGQPANPDGPMPVDIGLKTTEESAFFAE
jgi:hypothetical protein